MAQKKSTAIPKAMEEVYRSMTAMTDRFCQEHLDEDYARLAREAIAALCRKRPSPLRSGTPRTWCCGVLYALGQINFLPDKSNSPHMSMQDLCARFGVAPSTGGNKAKQVRDALGIRPSDHRWMLPSLIERSGLAWMVEVDGLPSDARDLPLTLQEEAFRKGLIPYVPAYHAEPEPGQPTRKDILDRYDTFRALNIEHQAEAAADLLAEPGGPVPAMAVRIGLAADAGEAAELDVDELTPALDLALYTPDETGVTRIRRYADSLMADASAEERRLLEAMGNARFSVYEITGRHPQAGMTAKDLRNGDEVWIMDRALERTASRFVKLAARLVRPQDFWITTGVAVPMNDAAIWQHLARNHSITLTRGHLEVPDPDRLDEIIYAAGLAIPQ